MACGNALLERVADSGFEFPYPGKPRWYYDVDASSGGWDPISNIQLHDYDSLDEKNYKVVEQDGTHPFTLKEYREYLRQVKESDGFDVMLFYKSFPTGGIRPITHLNDEVVNDLKALSESALRDYNQKENKKLEFMKVVKANGEVVDGVMYYITFDVRDPIDGLVKAFQAKVLADSRGTKLKKVKLCRPKKP